MARWFGQFATENSTFDVRLADLADFALPVFDEPNHPKLGTYVHDHTKAWSASVAAADAFVFVMPEYNAGPSPAFVNALCYLHKEWHHKPCGFVSYGGVSGGLRAVQLCKQIVTTLKLVPLIEGVPIPTVAERLDAEGRFVSNPLIDASARAMLPELERWSQALKPMRASGSEGQATR